MMGRQSIWDGEGMPQIGDEVLFEVASTPEIQKGAVESIDVVRYDKTRLNTWRITVHMRVGSRQDSYKMARLLEEVYPLTYRKEQKS